MDKLTDPLIKSALELLFRRCQTDMPFRERCLADPVAALEEVSGRKFPGYKIRFIEADDAYSDNDPVTRPSDEIQ